MYMLICIHVYNKLPFLALILHCMMIIIHIYLYIIHIYVRAYAPWPVPNGC